MKSYHLYFLAIALSFAMLANSQVKNVSNRSYQAKADTTTRRGAANNQKTMSQAADSLKFAVNDFKKSMNTLFGGKRDTIEIFISNVEYDDANLSALKESLKKFKGGRLVNMQYKSSAAILQVFYKGNPTELWDQLPEESKKAFKIVDAENNSLTLTARNK